MSTKHIYASRTSAMVEFCRLQSKTSTLIWLCQKVNNHANCHTQSSSTQSDLLLSIRLDRVLVNPMLMCSCTKKARKWFNPDLLEIYIASYTNPSIMSHSIPTGLLRGGWSPILINSRAFAIDYNIRPCNPSQPAESAKTIYCIWCAII